jgi:di/tricarboxylate transporter
MINLVAIVAVILAIFYGFKTKRNIGLIAISFAYIIGCFFLNLKASDIIGMWPIKIFFVVFSVYLFYNFAMANGTLENLSLHLLYYFRKIPKLIPFAFYVVTLIMAAMGVGNMPVIAFFTPIMLLTCQKTGISPLIGAMAINYGSLAGTNFMTSVNGVIYRSLMDASGYNNSFAASTCIFLVSLVIPIFVLILLPILSPKKVKINQEIVMEKPEAFNSVQRKNLILIVSMLVVVLILPILHQCMPNSNIISFINDKADIGLIAIIFAIIALFLNLGQEKEVISRVPWGTLLMISGMSILISVATKAGLIKVLASWVSSNLPTAFVPITITLISALMACFSSTIGVVCPSLFPVVPGIAAATGLNPMVLFTVIVIGGQSAAISPFSAAGNIIIGGCRDENTYNRLYPDLLLKAVPIGMIFGVAAAVILNLLF